MKTSVFAFFLCLYLLAAAGHLGNFDAAREYAVARNILLRRDPSLGDVPTVFVPEDGLRGRDGKLYSPTGIGASLVMIPMIGLAQAAARVVPPLPEEEAGVFLVSLLNSLFAGLVVLVLIAVLEELGFEARRSLSIAVLFGVGTMLFPYAKSTFDIVLATLLLSGSAYLLIRLRRRFSTTSVLVSGILLGSGLLVRVSLIAFLPALLGYLIWLVFQGQARPRHAALFLIPVLVGLTVVALFNWARFGSPWEAGYGGDPRANSFTNPVWLGLAGLLVSPGKGLFFYCPLLILVFSGARRFWMRHRPEALLFVGIVLPYLLGCARFSSWSGDYCWGPRYLLPLLPFVLAVAAHAFLPGQGLWARVSVSTVIVLSVVVQLLGVSLDPVRRIGYRLTIEGTSRSEIYWDPRASPIIDHGAQLADLVRGAVETDQGTPAYRLQDDHLDFWWIYAPHAGVPGLAVIAAVLGLLAGVGYFARRSWVLSKEPSCQRPGAN